MTETNVRYRHGQVQDAEAISTLGTRVFTLTFAFSMSQKDLQKYLSESYSISRIAADLESPSHTFLVATKDDAVVGFVQLTQGTSDPCIDKIESKVELQRLYVSEDLHGQGIGKRLLGRAEKEADDMGFKNVWLGVWEDNHQAQRVYQKAGYAKVGTHDFKMGDCVQTDWIMTKAM